MAREATPSAAVSEPALITAATPDPSTADTSILATIFNLLAPVLLLVWLLGSVGVASVTLVRVLRFRNALGKVAVNDADIASLAMRVAAQMKMRRSPLVRSVPTNVGPLVWAGAVRPLVVVPRPLWNSIGETERETLLAHELAHVVRCDHWVRRFEAVVLALYWWLPTAWLAVRRREAAAELCCDALVLKTYPDRPQAYAEVLFHAVSLFSTGRSVALASGLGRTTELKERLAMIVHNRIPGRPRTLAWLMLLLFGVTALFVSAQFVQADPAADASPAATPSKTPTADTAPFAQQATNAAAEGEVVDVPAADPFAGSSSPFSAKADEADPFGARKSPSSPSIASLRPDEILFFNASWVGPGQKMIPIVEKLQQEGIRFRILDVDKDAEIAKRHGVTKIPMFIAIKKGFEADRRTEVEIELNRLIGVQSEKSLRELAIRQVPYRSGDARTKTLEGLRNVIESKDEPAEVKIQAMRSYSRLAFSTDEEATAEKIFLDVAKAADNHRVKLAAAEALQTLGSPKGVELMWSLLETSSDADFQAVVTQRLNDAKAVPPSVESVRTLTGMMVGGALGAADSVRKEGDRLPNYSPGLLKRLASSGNGIARLVEAVEMSDETEEVNPDSSWMPPTSRSILLIILREAKPATDEITDALVEALSSKDAGVRAAAAQALGNPVEPKPASGRGMESGIGGRAPEPDQQPGYEAGAPETTLPSAPAGAPGQVRPTAPATPARPATGAPTKEPAQSPAISDKVRDELIKSLSAAAQDETATPESRAAALESLAKIAQGTENAAEVTAIAKRVLERASNALEQEGAAAALHRLGDSEGIEALWKALAMSKPKDSAMIVTEDSARIVNRLAVIETPVPATTEGIVALARFVAKIEKELDRGRRDSSHLLPLQVAGNDLLKRLYQSGQGVQRCIAAIESLEDSAHGLVAGTTEEDPQFEQQARARLLALLRRTEPTNDEVATALAEALSSDDSDVRKAAAEALGNVRRASKPEL